MVAGAGAGRLRAEELTGEQVHIRKVKILKQPKFDLGALMALHGESSADEQGQKVEREFREQVLESV